MKARMTRGTAVGLALGLVLLTVVPLGLTQEYTINPGDILDVSVLGESEVTGPATVGPDGTIVLQMIGKVQVAGLTLEQTTTKLTTELKKFIRDPRVVVSVRQAAIRSQFVYLLGEVVRPGAYEIRKEWTLAELIAVAGGTTPGSALPRALILRKNTTIPVNLEQLIIDGDASANITLEPGDVVIVPQTKNRVVIMGAVTKPGSYLFRDGDRVIDGLSAAGGPTPKAVIKEIGVVRQEGQKPTVVPVNLEKFYKDGDKRQNILLQAGDIVYVPETGVEWSTVLGSLSQMMYFFLLLK